MARYRSLKGDFNEEFKHKESLEVHPKAEGRYRMKNHATSETCQDNHQQEQQS